MRREAPGRDGGRRGTPPRQNVEPVDGRLPSEVCPTNLRAKGTSLGVFTHWALDVVTRPADHLGEKGEPAENGEPAR